MCKTKSYAYDSNINVFIGGSYECSVLTGQRSTHAQALTGLVPIHSERSADTDCGC